MSGVTIMKFFPDTWLFKQIKTVGKLFNDCPDFIIAQKIRMHTYSIGCSERVSSFLMAHRHKKAAGLCIFSLMFLQLIYRYAILVMPVPMTTSTATFPFSQLFPSAKESFQDKNESTSTLSFPTITHTVGIKLLNLRRVPVPMNLQNKKHPVASAVLPIFKSVNHHSTSQCIGIRKRFGAMW